MFFVRRRRFRRICSFKPTPEVRSFGHLVAHEADGQYEICGLASPKPVTRTLRKREG